MKFSQNCTCGCGEQILFETYGDGDWPSALCPACESGAFLIDPLSVSVTAERLLLRSKTELETEDYSMSIVVGTIAVESFLTELFLRSKRLDLKLYNVATAAQIKEWEDEYPRSGGFSKPANFVSKSISGSPFDDFVSENTRADAIMSTLQKPPGISPTQYFQSELFNRRNRIVHWGYVNSAHPEALLCYRLAVAIVSILRELDKSKYGNK